MRYISRFLVFTLILSLALPPPMVGHAANRNTDSGYGVPAGEEWGNTDIAQGLQGALPLAGGSKGQRGSLAAGDASSSRPKSITEMLFNAATGMMGMPGMANDRYDPYGPNANQDLNFRADGLSRLADGTTATNAGYGGRGTSGQGGYGSMNELNPLDRGLNYGMGLANNAAEDLFLGMMDSPYGGTRARFNFMVDRDGKVNGEGDLLLPWYDSKYTTVYSQFGARTMNAENSRDRWIGNFGLGQRWYPYAVNDGIGKDAGNLMLGYNVFLDNDFTRNHQRGGVGIEAQYDWLRLASNYYFPISSWRDSKDFDSNFVRERPAEGWDIRAKGYLPFYRNVAVTGSYGQWFGDNVGVFGASRLEKDPKVWSYGLEYTPVPLISGFVNQRSIEHGRSDTEFGLRFTYRFGIPWKDQISPSKVAELRTVSGSRHEFVDRENRIILEYKAKNNFNVEFVRRSGDVFTFRISNGFGNYVAGQTVRVSANGVTTLAEAKTEPATFLARAGEFLGSIFSISSAYAADLFQSYGTDRNGSFRVTITGFSASSTVTIQTGNTSRTFTAAELGGGGGVSNSYNLSGLTVDASGNLGGIITVMQNGSPASGVAITLFYATFGGSGTATPYSFSLGNTDSSGQVTVSGSVTALPRQIRFTANSDTASAVTKTVGTVPAGFITGQSLSTMNWFEAGTYCSRHGGKLPRVNSTASYPYGSYADNEPVDGFGAFGGLWPTTDVPSNHYWSGTEVSEDPSQSWYITKSGSLVASGWDAKSSGWSAICVP